MIFLSLGVTATKTLMYHGRAFARCNLFLKTESDFQKLYNYFAKFLISCENRLFAVRKMNFLQKSISLNFYQ